jgi:hypothetical protein
VATIENLEGGDALSFEEEFNCKVEVGEDTEQGILPT